MDEKFQIHHGIQKVNSHLNVVGGEIECKSRTGVGVYKMTLQLVQDVLVDLVCKNLTVGKKTLILSTNEAGMGEGE